MGRGMTDYTEIPRAKLGEILLTQKKGAAQTLETKKLMSGAVLFKPGRAYLSNASNLHNRARANGYNCHVRKATVDGEDGYAVWWDRREDAA
jgi:hypothetical protein